MPSYFWPNVTVWRAFRSFRSVSGQTGSCFTCRMGIDVAMEIEFFFFLSLHIWVCPSTEISLRTISKKDERQGGLLEGAWELFTSTSDNGHLWTNHLSFSSWSRWKIKKSTFHPHLLMAAIYFFIWCLILIKLHKNGPLSKGNRDSSVCFHQQVNCHNL